MNTMWTRCLLLSVAGLILTAAAPLMAQSQKMVIPAYFYPGADWTKAEAASATVRIMIMNPNSGPGDKINSDYVTQVKECQAHGVKVIGYVHTSYGKRAFSVVAAEAKSYFAWYHVNGIFYDEVAYSPDELPYYKECYSLIKSIQPADLVVLNPGCPVDEGYMHVSDIICTFESEYPAYQNSYTAPEWVKSYPASRFWHIILNVPTTADMDGVVALSKQRHAGYVYVTSVVKPNPYAALPPDPYWSDQLEELDTP